MPNAAPPAPNQRQAELLAGMEKKLKVVWEEASDAMAFIDDEGFLDCNDAARDLFGFVSSEAYLGAPLHHFAPATQCDGSSSREFLAREWGRAFESGRSRCECLLQRPDGSQFVADLVMTSISMGAGNILHLVFRDITLRWQREQALREAERTAADSLFQAANFDPLTGLANRRHLSQQIHQVIAGAESGPSGIALLCLDIRNFHSINNALGHDIGDLLLQTVAERLQRLAREGDVVARLGGNEFAILLQGERAALALTVTHQAIAELTRTILLNGRLVSIAPAIGISRWPEDAYHAESLIEHAGTALYAAKSCNQSYRQYAPAMRADALARVEMESHLRNGLELGEFFLHYQPQIEFGSGRIVGMEALVRWQHPRLGLIPPGQFIPLAEQTGLIIPLGEWITREACRQTQAWIAAGLPALRVAVNLSGVQFNSRSLIPGIERALADSGLAPDCLELELTESSLMESSENTVATLSALRAMGARLAIDDFGTGYSSLAYLRSFPLDRLKLDRSFVNNIESNPDDLAIARAIISLGHSLRLDVVAEGIEESGQFAVLADLGCDIAQGFLFSRPVPAGDLEGLLHRTTHLALPERT